MSNDKTKWIFDDEDHSNTDLGADFTESITDDTIGQTAANLDGFQSAGSDNETTRLVETNEKTQIFLKGQPGAAEAATNYDELDDPVVGWLVVIKGPGLGQSLPIGVGMNTVGRDSSARVAIAFGDKTISGSDHARVIYDDDTRAFFISHGSGKSITKVNGQMVATVLPLANYDVIELTKTTHVRFVAFCNEHFDWSDLADKT
jgi:hypothetical protein